MSQNLASDIVYQDRIYQDRDKSKKFLRHVRHAYIHDTCGSVTRIDNIVAETFARQPDFYSKTFCCACAMHFPVNQFVWTQSSDRVGS